MTSTDSIRKGLDRPWEESSMGRKLEVVRGVKGNKSKTYRRRAKNPTLRQIKKIIKES